GAAVWGRALTPPAPGRPADRDLRGVGTDVAHADPDPAHAAVRLPGDPVHAALPLAAAVLDVSPARRAVHLAVGWRGLAAPGLHHRRTARALRRVRADAVGRRQDPDRDGA